MLVVVLVGSVAAAVPYALDECEAQTRFHVREAWFLVRRRHPPPNSLGDQLGDQWLCLRTVRRTIWGTNWGIESLCSRVVRRTFWCVDPAKWSAIWSPNENENTKNSVDASKMLSCRSRVSACRGRQMLVAMDYFREMVGIRRSSRSSDSGVPRRLRRAGRMDRRSRLRLGIEGRQGRDFAEARYAVREPGP